MMKKNLFQNLVVIHSFLLCALFPFAHAEAVLVTSSGSVSISAQVGTIIPPIMGGGPISFGYYPPVHPEIVFACADGIDNDNDGLIDWGADPGCISNLGVSESEFSFIPQIPGLTETEIVSSEDVPGDTIETILENTEPILSEQPSVSGSNEQPAGPLIPGVPNALAITLPITFLSLLYNARRHLMHFHVHAHEWVLVFLSAFVNVLAATFFPSLFTAVCVLLYFGIGLLRYTTLLW